MNRIDLKFKELRRKKRKAFITFIMAGDPDFKTTERLVERFAILDVDILELGVPFSDPLADGPTIQRSAERSLKNKTNLKYVFRLIRRFRKQKQLKIPIVILTYYNIILRYGVRRFVQDAKYSGIDGVIVPDLPPEESTLLRRYAQKKDFSVVPLLAPTSPKERIRLINRVSSGFIYYVSLTGTTGAREKLPEELLEDLKKIKLVTKKPVCVGFGVSKPQQVKEISEVADGVIVGSAIIKVIEQNIGKKELVDKVERFVNGLRGYNSRWRG